MIAKWLGTKTEQFFLARYAGLTAHNEKISGSSLLNWLVGIRPAGERGNMTIKYYLWISTKAEKRAIKDGAIYVGPTLDAPREIKQLLDPKETRKYCVITK